MHPGVIANVTTLIEALSGVDALLGAPPFKGYDGVTLIEQVQEMVRPREDYETPLRQEGWVPCQQGGIGFSRGTTDRDELSTTWAELGHHAGVDPIYRRPVQFLIITVDKAAELEKTGQTLYDYEATVRALGWQQESPGFFRFRGSKDPGDTYRPSSKGDPWQVMAGLYAPGATHKIIAHLPARLHCDWAGHIIWSSYAPLLGVPTDG